MSSTATLTVRDIIEDPAKQVVDYGAWQTGPVPASKFPLRKQKRLKYSHTWSWRVIKFESVQRQFLVLLVLNAEIGAFSARLAIKMGDDWAIICTHELHLSHKNWHCHFVSGDVNRTNPGYLRDKENTVYFPSGGKEIPCTIEFNVTLTNAMQIAARRYRFEVPDQAEMDL
ncbi:hypothetical protein OSH10_05020 [Kaistia defluvii]|uniref:hypothetical protein n=1 Tax=Kaistia defluvii TaxID=410841 RepID=UPI002257C4EA|nr:hypothetical protein [Kaistia defluvii]MCX5517788.1 hypothetical protein [Kaistia defluvii]